MPFGGSQLPVPCQYRSLGGPCGACEACCLLPPGGGVGAEVSLLPRRQHNLAVDLVAVRQRERQGSGPTDHLAGGVVLRAVARAHVLVRRAVPRHDAAEVRAHSVDGVVLEAAILLDDQVVRVALQALHQRARGVGELLRPIRALHVVTKSVLGEDAAPATSAGVGDEEEDESTEHPQHGHPCSAKEHQVHDGTPLHVRHKVISSGGHRDGRGRDGAGDPRGGAGGRCDERGGGADEGEEEERLHGEGQLRGGGG
mmetsp:Transcript_10188/g.21653  ORF Transcript_10188/g.21653 Transcript_10188/m.21653 type:complete len:255 (+) Transcript_10188:208-972(+)